MKVLFIVPRFHTNLFHAVKALRLAGTEVHLYCREQAALEDHSFVKPTLIDTRNTTWSQTRRILTSIDPDLVVIRKVGRFSKVAFWVCVAQRRRVVAYDQRPLLWPRTLRKVAYDVLRGRPMHRITPVCGLKAPGSHSDRFATYLPFPVEATIDEDRRIYAPGGTVRIVCVGKLAEPRKNHFLLLRALEGLADKFAFTVTLVGATRLNIKHGSSEYLASLYAYAKEGALADRLTIRADVPFQEMANIYGQHDICVLPSESENLGTSPLEAMSHGCVAIVASDSGCAGYFQDTDCGLIFPTKNQSALTAVLARLLAEPEEIARMGRNAARYAKEEFSLETFARRFFALAASRQKWWRSRF